MHVHFVLYAVYQKLKTLVLETNMPEYSFKPSSKWFRLFHEIENAWLKLSGSTATLHFPALELNGNNMC